MTYIIFENNGVIDQRAITVLGASVKNDSAIGYFGTGLKFSIACILRHGCEISIFAGDKKLKFKSKKQKIRDKDFNVIFMNRKELSFTTQLGRDWKLWQALREIESNCLDEGGKSYKSETIPEPQEGKTIIVVSGQDFLDEYDNIDEIFVTNQNPIEENRYCDVYDGSGIFYRNVRVKDEVITLRKYNIKTNITLTEDRTAKYDFQIHEAIANYTASTHDKRYIEKIVTLEYGALVESKISFDGVSFKPSQEFMDVVGWLIKNKPANLKSSAKKLYEKYSPKIEPDQIQINDIEKKQLEKALSLCDRMGFPARNYPIKIYETIGDNVLAAAHEHEGGKDIILSKYIFSKGIMTLTRGLIEEYIHLQYGYDDCSLEMQNFIFDKMTAFAMQSIGEVA